MRRTKQLKSENEVLQELGVPSFRNVTKKQVVDLVNKIPYMNEKVAMKCLEQVPYYVERSKEVLTCYEKLCEKIADNNKSLTEQQIDAHRAVMSTCQHIIDTRENLTYNEYIQLINLMKEETDKIDDIMSLQQQFHERLVKTFGTVAAGFFIIGGSLLGGGDAIREFLIDTGTKIIRH